MASIMANITGLISLLAWVTCWFVGGYLLVVNTLRIQREEFTLIGLGVGLILEMWLTNFTGRFLPPYLAFWSSAVLVLSAGLLVTLIFKGWKTSLKNFTFSPGYWIAFLLITLIFFKIGRGLAINDDYQNLPITSYIAAGSIPPKFVLNPGLSFDYHYLMLIFSAQWMVIADMFPWTALDISRAISLGLMLVYVAMWVRHITKSALAGWLGLLFVAFSGGTRWLMLYLPTPLLNYISSSVEMIGSGKTAGETLAQAMQNLWVIDGVGPIQFPFAFGNSIHMIPIMGHGGVGMVAWALMLLIYLSFGRWKNWAGKGLVACLMMAMAMVDEIWFVYFMAASGFVLLYLIIRKQNFFDIPAWKALVFFFIPIGIVSLFQGGVITGTINDLLPKITGVVPAGVSEGYYDTNFIIRWPPTVISAHLGRLNLTNPGQLLAAIFEVGPILLVLPLLILWGIKAIRHHQWFYTAVFIASMISALALFAEYAGSAGIAANVRLPYFCYGHCKLFAVPLCWYWLKNKSLSMKMLVTTLAFFAMVGGMFYFGIESISGLRPVLSTFIDPMDAQMEKKYWNQLPEDTLVFDYMPSRSATIFARPSHSQDSWYSASPEFTALGADMDPYALNAAGYGFWYHTADEWNKDLSDTERARFDDPCVVVVEEIQSWNNDFRRLLDIRNCQSQP
jgi:hypothetical protein